MKKTRRQKQAKGGTGPPFVARIADPQRALVAKLYGVLGGLGAVLADGGIEDEDSVSVVVVVVPVVPDGSVLVVLSVVDSVSVSPPVAQAARDIVATASAAAVRVRSVAFMVVGPLSA